ncbi:hypothetical protein MHYP_G00241510 [Metynnis hypsauchen]
MSTFGCNRPTYLKTYGRQKRKVDLWFSPDLRKKAFSFSSTPSSDLSVSESSRPETRKKKSAAPAGSRAARRAMTALKELESDEENIIPDSVSRCRSVSAVVLLEEVDVTDILSRQSLSRNPEEQEMYPSSLEMELSTSASRAETGNGNQTYDVSDPALSNVCLTPLRISTSASSSSSLSVPPLSSPPAHESSDSAQALIDHLKAECLSSWLTVSLLPLDHRLLSRFQRAPPETQAASPPPPPPETKSDDQVMKSALHSGNAERVNAEGERSSGSEGQTAGVVRRLSNLFGPSCFPCPHRGS